MSTRVSYPASAYFDDDGGWGLLYDYHDLSIADLIDAATELDCSVGEVVVSKRYLACRPRVKRCDEFDWPGCDSAGDWHTHWSPVRTTDSPDFQFSFVTKRANA